MERLLNELAFANIRKIVRPKRQPRAVLDWSAGGGMPGGQQGVGFAGNYCKDAPQAFLGPKETLRYGRDLDLDRLCTTDRANLEKLREEAWRSAAHLAESEPGEAGDAGEAGDGAPIQDRLRLPLPSIFADVCERYLAGFIQQSLRASSFSI